MQRGFQDDIAGFDDVEHVVLHLWIVDTDKFFIEGYRQGRLTTEFGHERPLLGFDGLFDAMDSILRQQFQSI